MRPSCSTTKTKTVSLTVPPPATGNFAPTGTYPITITSMGGGVTHSTTLTFQVRR
jgi:hypothetical protein